VGLLEVGGGFGECEGEIPGQFRQLVELVGLLGAASHSDPLLGRLTDPAALVRMATASALGRLGAGEARDALVVALEDRVPAVRTASARALGTIGGRTAVAALVPVACGDTFEPARAAAEALAAIDPAFVVRLASEPDAGIHVLEAADRLSL
jgi:HEAT repeat protein